MQCTKKVRFLTNFFGSFLYSICTLAKKRHLLIFDEKIEVISYQLLFLTHLCFPCAHDLKHNLNRNYELDTGIENNCVFRKSM